ncbi:putative yippee family protein [Phaeomoniella chlamydospora]|uniref:Protein yippee-like n=1 Tax=Phaeomoniella chlamydospora TaxID=158046 RepID=A0A0G2GHD1_PHACM|nr:putative yippee family protein [Phaeomoniella chlamydospora]
MVSSGSSAPPGEYLSGSKSHLRCASVLGWKYVGADEESQRYKVGKFILETKRVRSTVCWENDADEPDFPDVQDPTRRRRSSVSNDMPFAMDEHDFTMPPDRLDKIEDVEFDSQDEDECDDLFAGVWSPHLASKRRKSKMFGRG